jgi:hypothetical protein
MFYSILGSYKDFKEGFTLLEPEIITYVIEISYDL